jgi:hypothetical protein
LAKLPQVADVAYYRYYFQVSGNTNAIGATTMGFGTTLNTFHFVEGRMYRSDAPDEAVATIFDAALNRWHVGQTLHLHFTTQDGADVTQPVRLVGTMVTSIGFPPRATGQGQVVFLSPSFEMTHPTFAAASAAVYRLKRGSADVDAFKAELAALAGDKPIAFGFESRVINRGTVRAIHVQAIALWLLAGLLALTAVATMGQSFARQMYLESDDHPTLQALGMSRRQLAALGLLRAEIIGVASALIAWLVAAALSPLSPIGIARAAELHPGFRIDVPAFAIAFAAMVLCAGMLAAIPAWRTASLRTGPGRNEPSRIAEAGAVARLSPSAVVGIRLALEPGKGHTALPVRSTMLGMTIGIAAVAAAIGFVASLAHLLQTPQDYGWNWTRVVTTNNASLSAQDLRVVRTAPGIDSIAVGTVDADIAVDGMHTSGIIMDRERGTTEIVPLLDGREPVRAGEVLLGRKTLRDLHRRIGDTVRLQPFGSERTAPFTIVGTGVFPVTGNGPTEVGGLNTGSLITGSSLPLVLSHGIPPPDTMLVHIRTGEGAEALAAMARDPNLSLDTLDLPPDVVNFGRVQDLPYISAGLLALLALITMIHALVTSTRRRRRDLAILKTIGMARAQLRSTVFWQASTFVLVALVVGIPLGLIAARWGWDAFAGQLGVVPDVVLPAAPIWLLIPAALIAANLIAAAPARTAARVGSALALRTE